MQELAEVKPSEKIDVCLFGQLIDIESLKAELNQQLDTNAIEQTDISIYSELRKINNQSNVPLIFANLSLKAEEPAVSLPSQVFSIAMHENYRADLYISKTFSIKQLASAINVAVNFLLNQKRILSLSSEVELMLKERKDLSKIGIALSAEKDLDKLLTMVLREGRILGNCEAASLYLIEEKRGVEPSLIFKLTQNSEIDFDFEEQRFLLTNRSLAGYVALTGETLNINDAYKLPLNLPYRFDNSFDVTTGYKTQQLLVLPMRNHQEKIIGVLQFINNKKSKAMTEQLGFSRETESLLSSLASQAAVAIDNSQLIENVQQLFEGFVSASVKAIESRDPVTSGHSFRVAELTTGLAKVLDSHPAGKYRALKFSRSQMREIRYASLLHDFGKVGVKEDVLLKPNKLHDNRLNYLVLKLEWQKQILQRKFFQKIASGKEPELLNNWEGTDEYEVMKKKLAKLDKFRVILEKANRPSLLEEEVEEELNHLFEYQVDQSYPFGKSLLSHEDFLSLSVKKGSLTPEERMEIQSHVVHTEAFLREIPWTDGLSFVPKIAASHHEKLDGTGYPMGIREDDIPIPSKIMAVADIYDALTARDRPYKKAVPIELALDILNQEAQSGKLCKIMVSAFIEAKVFNQS